MRKLVSIVLPLLVLVSLVPTLGLAQDADGQPVPFALGDGKPGVPAGVEDVLFEQVYDGYGWWASQCFPDYGWCYYTADDFVNDETWTLESVFVDGSGAIENADSLNWVVYPDAGGMPSGYPGDGLDLWTVSLAPGTPGITISDGGDVYVDFLVALGGAMEIPAGHWWFIFFPTMAINPYGQWGWHTGQPSQYYPGVQHIVAPPWQPQCCGYAFRFEGGLGPTVFATHVRIAPLGGSGLLLGIVRIATGDGATPVPGATVDVTWTLPIGGGYVFPQTKTTNANGMAFPIMVSNWPGTYVLDLVNVTAAGYMYDPGANWESSASWSTP